MSAMIQLTDADFTDLLAGATINVEDEHGTEIVLGPKGLHDFSIGELSALENGAELFLSDGHRICYPDLS